MQSWNYKTQDVSIQHIGPMAQDFNTAFGVGEPDKAGERKYINSLDVDGVALASIQGLYQASQTQAARIATLESQNAAQQAQLDLLQQRLDKLEKQAAIPTPADNTQGATILPLGLLGAGGFGLTGLLVAKRRQR